ncbi:3-keto-disaccharide hydrolase [Planctomicrobium sp. SH661]|uniref:3-keto-disaccharide hydrolase n=1 Tax=Planctomicrobium sp. SH661 TaxID=3448124 RepID=UPI003F5CAB47
MVRRFMLTWLPCLMLGTCACAADANNPAYSTVEEAKVDPDFELQGEYAGDHSGVQVIALGGHKFQVVKFQGGLPGAGWDGSDKVTAEGTWDEVKGHLEGLKKVDRKSPTLGLKAPEGAVVLFDGTPESLKKHWKEGAKITEDGLLQQGVTSNDEFGDFTAHVEFLLPYMPKARGQGRGNSGLYLQGRYEVQMLDSFGLKGEDNECGGIYKAAAPSINMCFPPLAWQTYDIDFTAAKFDDQGKKISNARTTVKHNGVTIHDDLELPEGTPGGPVHTEGPKPGPLFLQDHSNPVRYRNIWVLPKS